MDLMEKWDDIMNYFNRGKKKKKQVKEENPDEALDDDDSPNSPSSKGSTGLIPGIKRQWVRGGAIFITIVFVLAVIYGTDLGEEENKNAQNNLKKQDLVTNDKDEAKRATGSTNDYEALLAENKRRQEEAARKNLQAQQQGQANQQQQRPQVPQQQPQQPTFAQQYTLPSQNPNQFANQYAQQQAALLQQQEAERQRREQEAERAETARIQNQYQSSIAFSLGGSSMSGAGGGSADTAGGAVQATSTGSYTPVTGNYTPVGERTLVAGTLIPVMLLTGINTDAPGQVMCQVQSDIYDFTGTNLLIPAGSRILGKYESNAVSNGRVSVTFSSLQSTDGGTWSIGDSLIAVDGAGYSGISGKIHHHTGRKIGGGLFGSAIAALGSLAAGNTSSVNTYSAGQIASQGALANLIQTTSSMFNEAANVQNTVTVEPGYMFCVYVTNNINF